MADQQLSPSQAGTSSDSTPPMSGLAMLREAAYGGQGPQQAMDLLMGSQIVDPSAKWNAYAAGALKPATGGFGESMGNALGALSEGQMKEAELKSKYVPLIANALMQRQLQAAQLAMNQWTLTKDFDKAGLGALTGLLAKSDEEGPITKADAAYALNSVVTRGLMPPDYASRLYGTLPDNVDLRRVLTRLSIGGLEGKEAVGAVTPNVKLEDVGGSKRYSNLNPNAPGGIGPVAGAPVLPMTPSPTDVSRAGFHAVDQANNPIVGNTLAGTAQYPNQGPPARGLLPGTGAPPAGLQLPGATPVAPPGPGAPSGPGLAPGLPGSPPIGAPPGGPISPPIRSMADVEFQKDVGKKLGGYYEDLDQSLQALRNTQMRLGEMRQLVTQYRPGAAGDLRLQLGAWAKDLSQTLGLTPEQSASISSAIAKGDVSSAQAFQKLAIQGTIDILKAATPRFTQAEFAVVSKNSPNIILDPAAFDKMQNFMTNQYRYKSAESQEFMNYYKSGQDITNWPNEWNKMSQQLGFVKPTFVSNIAQGSRGTPKSTRVGVALDGRPVRWDDQENGWVFDSGK